MEFTVRINVKVVLTVFLVGFLMVGSFFAGRHYPANKPVEPVVSILASGTGFDAMLNEAIRVSDFCKAHPNAVYNDGSSTKNQVCTSTGDVPSAPPASK
jgi:hypothetical protein